VGFLEGKAYQLGRLTNAYVCLDSSPAEADGAGCTDATEVLGRLNGVGYFRLDLSEALFNSSDMRALIDPTFVNETDDAFEGVDAITGKHFYARVRCGETVCSTMTDVHARAMDTGMSSVEASERISKGLLGLVDHVASIPTIDGTAGPEDADAEGYALVALSMAMYAFDAWETVASRLLLGVTVRLHASSGGKPLSLPGAILHLPNASHVLAAVASSVRGYVLSNLVLREGVPVEASQAFFRIAPNFGEAVEEAAATLGLGLDFNAELIAASEAVVNLMTVMSVKVWDSLTAPDALMFYIPDGLSEEEVAELKKEQAKEQQLASFDQWFEVEQWLARGTQLLEEVASSTYGVAIGNMTTEEFARSIDPHVLNELVESTPVTRDDDSLTVGCMDTAASTYSFAADLQRTSYCLYSDVDWISALQAMNWTEWLSFLYQLIAFCWLTTTVVAAGAFQIQAIFLRQQYAVPPKQWPVVSVLVPCYMPNEQNIIEETLDQIAGQTEYEGELRLFVPYNSPVDLPIQDQLGQLKSLHGRPFRAHRVAGSASKAHNLTYALENMIGDDCEVVVIFDADHHPRPDTIRSLVAALHHQPAASCVQGAVLVERGGYFVLRCILDGMEWASWSFWGPGMSLITGTAYFGGGNAAWRPAALRSLGFDSSMLTEDIDVTIRAIALGHKFAFLPWAQVGELCPPTITAFVKQRFRWTMGWEQVTGRRIESVFSSTKLSERAKWRVNFWLIMRYISICTACSSVSLLVVNFAYWIDTGNNMQLAPPLMVVGELPHYLVYVFMVGLLFCLFMQREPWSRFLNVLCFLPISTFYFIFVFSMIVYSWFVLACCQLKWVPTARSAKDAEHAIKIPGSDEKHPS